MPLTQGTKLGPYEIAALLGAGGQGEVYSAQDTRLHRTVAMKILPSLISATPELKKRFEREAQMIAALNHPGICTIHDVGHEGGVDFLVMEFLEGETLAKRLEKGPLPVDQALAYATQIADALDKAHRKGITHRDLKPANIMVTRTGTKLMDFGLAKPASSASATLAEGPTISGMTVDGAIIGTLQYMAPEQLEGRDSDARTDLFAFGAVLHEMITGHKAFQGKSQMSLIAAIMEHQPPALSSLQPMTPRALESLVHDCLAKDPEDRPQSARDIARELKWISAGAFNETEQVSRPKRERLPWILFAATVLVALGLATMALTGIVNEGAAPTNDEPRWVSIVPPNSGSAVSPAAAISPDGKKVVFRARNDRGEDTLWMRTFGSPVVRELPNTQGAFLPFWDPGSQNIAFFSGTPIMLRRVAASGGEPQPLAEAPNPRGGTWNKDNVILFVPSPGQLHVIAASGGKSQPVSIDAGPGSNFRFNFPHFLPDGRHFVFVFSSEDVKSPGLYAGSVESPQIHRIGNWGTRAEYANGFLVFGQGSSLLAQRFDTDRLELTGQPYPLANRVGTGYGDLTNYAFSLSQSGVLVYSSLRMTPETQLVQIDREGRRHGTIGEPGHYWGVQVSPDEKRAALERDEPETNTVNIWLMDLASGSMERFTSFRDPGLWAGTPVWSSSGDRIFYRDFFRSFTAVLARKLNESAIESLPIGRPPGWLLGASADGKYLLYQWTESSTGYDLGLIDLTGDRQAKPYLNSPSNEMSGRISPDSRWLAYVLDDSGKPEVWVQSFPNPGQKRRISTDGGWQPHWHPDSKGLYYVGSDRKLWDVTFSSSAAGLEISGRKVLFDVPMLLDDTAGDRQDYAVLDNGRRFIFNAITEDSEPTSFTVVFDWPAAIRQ